MKKIFLLLGLFSMSQLKSQPIMNKLYDFQIGHVYSYKKVPAGWHIDTSLIQTIGSGLTWNFDTLSLLSTVYSDSIIDPSGTIGSSSFSTADFVWKEYSGTLQYYRKNADTVFYMGHYIWFPTTFTPNPATCVFNTPQSTNFLYNNFSTNVAGGGTWTYSARYNASGTLKLPGVTHNNVGLYVTVGGASTKYADYLWFKENQNDPVLRIQFVWNATSSTVQYLYVNTTALIPSKVDDFEGTEFTLTPNPAIDVVNIEAPFRVKQYDVMNIFGQTVIKKALNNNKFPIDIGDLTPGIYFVTITDELNKKITQRLMK